MGRQDTLGRKRLRSPNTLSCSGLSQGVAGIYGVGREYPQTTDWILAQLLTSEQGLDAVKLDAAYAFGDETRRGHLAAGRLGDITILFGDLRNAAPDEIRAISVVATIVAGTPVFCADPWCAGRPED